MDTMKKREDDATSKETLEDLEDSEDIGETDDADGPSPDGALDEPDELHNADPM